MQTPQRRAAERARGQRGISIAEVLVGIALVMMGFLFIPSMSGTIQRQRAAAVARQLTAEVRQAQSRAVSTGWEFRLVGFPSTATNGRQKQFRLLGRTNSVTAWPDALGSTTNTATQFAGAWVNPMSDAPGVNVNPTVTSGDAFWVTFDARGAVINRSNFTPLSVASAQPEHGDKSITVAASGRVTIQ